MASLPPELILHIMQCLVPSKPPVAFRASHPVTRTLLSFSLTCRLTSAPAVRLLHLHCLHMDSNERLGRLIATSPRLSATTTNNLSTEDRENACDVTSLNSNTSMGLYISPFLNDSIDEPLIVQRVHSLFLAVSLSLRRLVIDMPLRLLYPEDDHNRVRPILRAAFASLAVVEEFCSVRDELFLDTVELQNEPEVWTFWPHLKRLALYNVDVSSFRFLAALQKCEGMTNLVLTRPDGLEESIEASEFLPLPHLQRVMIVNTAEGHRQSPLFRRLTWRSCFLGRIWTASPHFSPTFDMAESAAAAGDAMDRLLVRIDVPMPTGREGYDPEVCQEWVRDHAIDGSLWELHGEPISRDMEQPPS